MHYVTRDIVNWLKVLPKNQLYDPDKKKLLESFKGPGEIERFADGYG